MSAESKDKKKSKFGIKNGLKGLKRRMSKSDNNNSAAAQAAAQQAASSNGASPEIDAQLATGQDTTKSSGKRRLSLKKKKPERPRLPRLTLDEFEFPKEIKLPSESWGKLQYDDDDRSLHEYLVSKYETEIGKLKFFPSDVILRFVISQRGMRPFPMRMQETENHFKDYLTYHYTNHYDDVLTHEKLNCSSSLSSLKEDTTALPLIIYGQDREGHPIFWDDGSAYGKDADLEVFKKDMKRVGLFRSRLMKRMHNIKLCASQKYGRMIYKHCMVMNLEDFNAKKFVKDRKFHEENTKMISDLFPEVLHRLYIINAPWAFRSAWKVIQTFLHPITVEKTKILGKDYIDELAKDIDLSMIPYKFGGTGPWDEIYGQEPEHYPLSTKDTKFDYTELAQNTAPAPPRAPVPDMNKHKAKQMKQMKESGIKGYEADKQFTLDDLANMDDTDEKEDAGFYSGVQVDQDEEAAAKSDAVAEAAK